MTILTILACFLPTILYISIIYWADRYEKEPIWLLAAAFIWGAGPSIVAAIFLNSFVTNTLVNQFGYTWSEQANTAILAPIIEESLKGIALLAIFIWRRGEIDSLLDGIIYGAMVGMGFAMVENYFYFSNEFATGGLSSWTTNVFFRAFVFGFNHSLFSSLLGLGFAIATLSKNQLFRILGPILGWAFAIFFHFVHNLTVSSGSELVIFATAFDWGGVLMVVGIIIWALAQERSWIEHYLKEEVAIGTMTTRQYERACSYADRTSYLWDLLTHHSFGRYRQASRFYQLCSKLAYQKHHAEVHPEDIARIAEMRNVVADLSHRL